MTPTKHVPYRSQSATALQFLRPTEILLVTGNAGTVATNVPWFRNNVVQLVHLVLNSGLLPLAQLLCSHKIPPFSNQDPPLLFLPVLVRRRSNSASSATVKYCFQNRLVDNTARSIRRLMTSSVVMTCSRHDQLLSLPRQCTAGFFMQTPRIRHHRTTTDEALVLTRHLRKCCRCKMHRTTADGRDPPRCHMVGMRSVQLLRVLIV